MSAEMPERDISSAPPDLYVAPNHEEPYVDNRPFDEAVHYLRADLAEKAIREANERAERAERWKRIAYGFRFRADHAMSCRTRKTASSDDCTCPLRATMTFLEEALAAERESGEGER